jgi:uncharacterized protein YceH (UPF0502 family)
MDDPLPPLNAEEIRVLGCLIEKQITTPDYYPLSLNALTNACNQLSNREPVVSFDETTVVRTIEGLREKRLASLFSGQESRVAKYKHALTDRLSLTPAEVALLTVLMLRGPQTVGELRGRTDRLFTFDSLPEVEEALTALAARRPQPLVAKLPRQPGTKESRYAQLLGGPIASPVASIATAVSEPASVPAGADRERIAKLEAEVARLGRDLAELREQFGKRL